MAASRSEVAALMEDRGLSYPEAVFLVDLAHGKQLSDVKPDIFPGKGAKGRVWVEPYMRESEHVAGYWRTIDTIGEAESWMRDRYPEQKFDFTGCDVGTLLPALEQFNKLAEKYPFALEGWSGIVVSDPESEDAWESKLTKNAHAGYRHSDKMLLLNSDSWGNPEKMSGYLQAANLAGWHPDGCTTPPALLTHEFGHMLDRELSEAGDIAWREPYGTDYGRVSETWKKWRVEADATPVSEYAVSASRGVFGRRDDSERIAEALASSYFTPDDLKEEYVTRLEFVLDSIANSSGWVPSTNDRSIDFEGERTGGRAPLTEDERSAWKEERRRWMARAFGPLWTVQQGWQDLYDEFYNDAYHERVRELWDRKHESRLLKRKLKEQVAA